MWRRRWQRFYTLPHKKGNIKKCVLVISSCPYWVWLRVPGRSDQRSVLWRNRGERLALAVSLHTSSLASSARPSAAPDPEPLSPPPRSQTAGRIQRPLPERGREKWGTQWVLLWNVTFFLPVKKLQTPHLWLNWVCVCAIFRLDNYILLSFLSIADILFVFFFFTVLSPSMFLFLFCFLLAGRRGAGRWTGTRTAAAGSVLRLGFLLLSSCCCWYCGWLRAAWRTSARRRGNGGGGGGGSFSFALITISIRTVHVLKVLEAGPGEIRFFCVLKCLRYSFFHVLILLYRVFKWLSI